MSNILAAKVLMSHLPDIADGAYKTATEIAIEVLLKDAAKDYWAIKPGVPVYEYLELTKEQYMYWVKGNR